MSSSKKIQRAWVILAHLVKLSIFEDQPFHFVALVWLRWKFWLGATFKIILWELFQELFWRNSIQRVEICQKCSLFYNYIFSKKWYSKSYRQSEVLFPLMYFFFKPIFDLLVIFLTFFDYTNANWNQRNWGVQNEEKLEMKGKRSHTSDQHCKSLITRKIESWYKKQDCLIGTGGQRYTYDELFTFFATLWWI